MNADSDSVSDMTLETGERIIILPRLTSGTVDFTIDPHGQLRRLTMTLEEAMAHAQMVYNAVTAILTQEDVL